MEIVKQVAIMMPFGSGERTQVRRATLEFLRIKYLIESLVQVKGRGGSQLRYSVTAYNLNVGDIPGTVIKAIAEADVLVGVLTEKNVNVAYELAVRNLLKDEMLLLVKGKTEDVVPFYLRTFANIQLDHFDGQQVSAQIELLAGADAPELNQRSAIPDELAKAIRDHDAKLRGELERSLDQLEREAPKRPDYILDLARYLDPGRMLNVWTTYYPYSVVRIRWLQKSTRRAYEPTDMDGPAVVYSANSEFFRLYNIAGTLPPPDGSQPLTGAELLAGLKDDKIVEDEDLVRFNKDNERVTRQIIFRDGFAWSAEPLRLNHTHPLPEYRDTSWLPTMSASGRSAIRNARTSRTI